MGKMVWEILGEKRDADLSGGAGRMARGSLVSYQSRLLLVLMGAWIHLYPQQ